MIKLRAWSRPEKTAGGGGFQFRQESRIPNRELERQRISNVKNTLVVNLHRVRLGSFSASSSLIVYAICTVRESIPCVSVLFFFLPQLLLSPTNQVEIFLCWREIRISWTILHPDLHPTQIISHFRPLVLEHSAEITPVHLDLFVLAGLVLPIAQARSFVVPLELAAGISELGSQRRIQGFFLLHLEPQGREGHVLPTKHRQNIEVEPVVQMPQERVVCLLRSPRLRHWFSERRGPVRCLIHILNSVATLICGLTKVVD